MSLVPISTVDCKNFNNSNFRPVDDYYINHYQDHRKKYYLNYNLNNIVNNDINNNIQKYLLYIDGEISILPLRPSVDKIRASYAYNYIIQKGKLLTHNMILKKIHDQQENIITNLEKFTIDGRNLELIRKCDRSRDKNFKFKMLPANCMIFKIVDNIYENAHNSNYHIIMPNGRNYFADTCEGYIHTSLDLMLYYRDDEKNKYYISCNMMAQKYKYIISNKEYEAMMFKYDLKKDEYQVIKKWKITYDPNYIISLKLAKEIKEEKKTNKLMQQKESQHQETAQSQQFMQQCNPKEALYQNLIQQQIQQNQQLTQQALYHQQFMQYKELKYQNFIQQQIQQNQQFMQDKYLNYINNQIIMSPKKLFNHIIIQPEEHQCIKNGIIPINKLSNNLMSESKNQQLIQKSPVKQAEEQQAQYYFYKPKIQNFNN